MVSFRRRVVVVLSISMSGKDTIEYVLCTSHVNGRPEANDDFLCHLLLIDCHGMG